MEPGTPALGMWNFKHWITKEVPFFFTLFRSLLTYHLIKKTFLTIVYKLFYVKYNPVPPYPFCFGAEFSCGSTNMVISMKYLILNFNLFL